MRKLMLLGLIFVVAASAQMIYGDWYCADYDWSLRLAEDGSYVSQSSVGTSVGTYFIESNGLISFQDAYTAQATSYSLEFAGDVMQFTDVWGTSYLFARVGSAAAGLPPGTSLASPASSSPVLAEKDGYVLRERHIEAGIEVLEFMVDEPLTDEESRRLQDTWVRDFEADPQAVFEDLDALVSTRDKLYSIQDPWQVAMLRASLVGVFHNEALKTPKDDRHEFLKVMYAHVEVVAFDPANLLAFTRKDLDAYLDYAAFLVALNTGEELCLSAAQRDSIAREVAEAFPSMTLQEKEVMCGMDVISKYVNHAWEQADPSERVQFATQMVETPAEDLDYSSYAPSSSGSSSGKPMDMATYNMLQNSIMDAHNSALNALSAINDPPYYYELTTY